MTSQVLNRWIVQGFMIDLLVCAAAYALQRVNAVFYLGLHRLADYSFVAGGSRGLFFY